MVRTPIPLRRTPAEAASSDAAVLSQPARIVLNRLRLHARRCRSAARLGFADADRLTGQDAALSDAAALEAVIRALAIGLDRSPRFYPPGTEETTFDEAWLLALIRAGRDGDTASARFLLRRRIAAPARPALERLLALAGGRVDFGGLPIYVTDRQPAAFG